jgi:hypothetical protein
MRLLTVTSLSGPELITCCICTNPIMKSDIDGYVNDHYAHMPLGIGVPDISGSPGHPKDKQAPCFLPEVIKKWHTEMFEGIPIESKVIRPHELNQFPVPNSAFDFHPHFDDVVAEVKSFNPDIYIAIPRGGLIPTIAIAGAHRQHNKIRCARFRTINTSKVGKRNGNKFAKNDLCCRMHGIAQWHPSLRVAIIDFIKSGATITKMIQEYNHIASVISEAMFPIRFFGINAKLYKASEKPRQDMGDLVFVSKNSANPWLDDSNSFFGKKRGGSGHKCPVKFSCDGKEYIQDMTRFEYVLWMISFNQLQRQQEAFLNP